MGLDQYWRHQAWLVVGLTLLIGCGPTAPAPQTGSGAVDGAGAGSPRPIPTAAPFTPTATPASANVETGDFSRAGWKTNFQKKSVSLNEIMSGGPPRDGIPPIDRPVFQNVAEADAWLAATEPVVVVERGQTARAYPLQQLMWHEIVNDEIDGAPVTITFCPLCNTAIAFDRRVNDQVLDFGTTGNLRGSDLVMWDRQTESWWQQITGEAIVGDLTGARLTPLPAPIVGWSTFKAARPNGQVLSKQTGFSRDYGRNPYIGYDQPDQTPFLYRGALDRRLPPLERVVLVTVGAESVAYPFTQLAERQVISDTVGGRRLVIFHQAGVNSALDVGTIAKGRDIGATGVFRAELDDRTLAFRWTDDSFTDLETGSRWNLLGQAIAGPLLGRRLEPVVHGNPFWFAAASHVSGLRLWQP